MKTLVISDTHGNTSMAFKAHTQSEPVDAVLHLGDGCRDAELLKNVLNIPVLNIAGNCDFGSKAPRELLWECEGKRILMSHGDAYGVKGGLARLEQRAREVKADAVLFGHSHIAMNEQRQGLLVLNPGALTSSARQQSYAVMDITSDSISANLFDID